MNTIIQYSDGKQLVCKLKMDAPIPCKPKQIENIMSAVLNLMYEDADKLQETLYNAQYYKNAETEMSEESGTPEDTEPYEDTKYYDDSQETDEETASEEFAADTGETETEAKNQEAMYMFTKMLEMTNPIPDNVVCIFQMLTPDGNAILVKSGKKICLNKALEELPGVETLPVRLEKIRNSEELTAFFYNSAGSEYSELHLLIPKQENPIPDRFFAVPESFEPSLCCAKILYDSNFDRNYDDLKAAVEMMLNKNPLDFRLGAGIIGGTDDLEKEDTFGKIMNRINQNYVSIFPVILETGNALLVKAKDAEPIFESVPDMAVIPVTRKSINTKNITTNKTKDIEVFLYEPGTKSDLYLLVIPEDVLDLNNKFYAVPKNIPTEWHLIKYDEIAEYRKKLEESGMELLFHNPPIGYKVLRQGGCKGGTEYEKDILYTVPGMAVLHENGIHYAPFTEEGKNTCMMWYKNDYRDNQLVMVQVREADTVEDKGRCASTGMIVLDEREWD